MSRRMAVTSPSPVVRRCLPRTSTRACCGLRLNRAVRSGLSRSSLGSANPSLLSANKIEQGHAAKTIAHRLATTGVTHSLYNARKSHGLELLRIVQSSDPTPTRITASVQLVQKVVGLMKASPDLVQLRRTLLALQQQYNSGSAGQLPGRQPTYKRHVASRAANTAPVHSSKAPPPCSRPNDCAAGDCSSSGTPWDWSFSGLQLAVYGLGSVGRYRQLLSDGGQGERGSTRATARLHQLALALVLQEELQLLKPTGQAAAPALQQPGTAPAVQRPADHAAVGTAAVGGPQASPSTPVAPVVFVDPDFIDFDVDLITALGGQAAAHGAVVTPTLSNSHSGASVTQDAERGGARAEASTPGKPARMLYYMPCCPRDLYEAVVTANLAAGTLHDVAVLGNSCRAQADSALLLQALVGHTSPEKFSLLSRSGAVAEALTPDFAAHGVAIAMHMFPRAALQRVLLQQQ